MLGLRINNTLKCKGKERIECACCVDILQSFLKETPSFLCVLLLSTKSYGADEYQNLPLRNTSSASACLAFPSHPGLGVKEE
jgi:hypothetical protein